jgi:hypothetical protein
VYACKDDRGRAGYHPSMMVKLLVYGYCVGKTSSRKMERATHEDVAFRVLAGEQHPDHDSSKHKAMSYGRMSETEKKLEEEVRRLLEEAERVDAEEDAKFGKSVLGDELPKELQRRDSRLKKIREAMPELEAEAKVEAEVKAAEAKKKLEERAKKETETGKKTRGPAPAVPDAESAKPDPKSQRNFTDSESRIMPDGAHKGSFIQAYNAQIAVDSVAQIIVAVDVVQEPNDKRQLVPMLEQVKENVGRMPDATSADAGYFSEAAIEKGESMGTELLVPPHRQKHGDVVGDDAPTEVNSAQGRMREKLRTTAGHDLYRMRKAIVEPVFGQIKEARGLRRFFSRGVANVRDEFRFIALTHNLLKLFRARGLPTMA